MFPHHKWFYLLVLYWSLVGLMVSFVGALPSGSLLSDMEISAPQQPAAREESGEEGKAIIPSLQKPWQHFINASTSASLMSRSEPLSYQHGGNRNRWLSFVPDNRVTTLLQREQKRSSFMIYVLMLRRHIAFYHEPVGPYGHLTIFHMLRPCFFTLPPAFKNVIMSKKRWVNALSLAFHS